ncbi:Sec3 domain-containing protein [Rhizoctonia solani AG-1 IA]|uniref:Sec3 domain-containing protein n=1 Tax=Thanatephorus cucumeris (strain AG1-IA) TaxID=983506 RepID=L8WFL1_THACA|nr:Sec3 domain-containing protein [Rhizoctonia solani AG-1 IA]
MNWSRAVSLAKYSELWRSYRRILNNWLNKRTTTQFNVIQERQAHSLLRRLLNTTNNLQPFHSRYGVANASNRLRIRAPKS